jgi:hypothetical protein
MQESVHDDRSRGLHCCSYVRLCNLAVRSRLHRIKPDEFKRKRERFDQMDDNIAGLSLEVSVIHHRSYASRPQTLQSALRHCARLKGRILSNSTKEIESKLKRLIILFVRRNVRLRAAFLSSRSTKMSW